MISVDQDGHHVDDGVIFMEKDWNGRSHPMPSSHHDQEFMEFIETDLWSQ